MKALVTGAAGFLGSHLSDELLKKSYTVIGIDNFFRGKKEYLPHHNNFSFYNIDLAKESKKIVSVINKEKPEVVFHYAAINGTEYFYDIPYKVLHDNIFITQHVLAACQDSSVKKIIYASSSETYGEPLEIPTPETHPILLNIHTVRDSYASSKAICDFYVKLFALKNNIDFLIFRIFNTYGPRMDTSKYGQVIPEFICKMLKSEEFSIIGDGTQTRSFCYVTDHTRLAIQLAEKISNEIINLGNDDEITINDLAHILHKLEGKSFSPKYIAPREYDHKRRCPDISKLKRLLNNQPTVSLEEGLRLTLEAYKKKNNIITR